jgi:hypothetical protein
MNESAILKPGKSLAAAGLSSLFSVFSPAGYYFKDERPLRVC